MKNLKLNLLTIIALIVSSFVFVSCGDDEKDDDPQPKIEDVNNIQPLTTPCTDLDVTKLVGKKWYKSGSSGTAWIQFKSDSTFTMANLPYSTVDTKGTWKKSVTTCVINMSSEKNGAHNDQPIKVLEIGENQIVIGNKMDFSNKITFKTTP